jgi:transcriptional regulator with XRE-family HTH domain
MLLNGSTVNVKGLPANDTLLPFGSMQSVKPMTDLGKRIVDAIAERGTTQTALEREVFGETSRGGLSRIVSGSRGAKRSINPATLDRIAQALGVRFEWLAFGRLPMRDPAGGVLPPKQEAMRIAQRYGVTDAEIAHVLSHAEDIADDDERGWLEAFLLLHDRRVRAATPHRRRVG